MRVVTCPDCATEAKHDEATAEPDMVQAFLCPHCAAVVVIDGDLVREPTEAEMVAIRATPLYREAREFRKFRKSLGSVRRLVRRHALN